MCESINVFADPLEWRPDNEVGALPVRMGFQNQKQVMQACASVFTSPIYFSVTCFLSPLSWMEELWFHFGHPGLWPRSAYSCWVPTSPTGMWPTVNVGHWPWILWPRFSPFIEPEQPLHCLWVPTWHSLHCSDPPLFLNSRFNAFLSPSRPA